MSGGLRRGWRDRRRCESVAASVPLPWPFDLQGLCDRVAAERGRPLCLVFEADLVAGGGPCGMWLATDDSDVVVVEAHTSALHQEQIVLHELAHILCGHGGEAGPPDPAALARLVPSVSEQAVRRMLGRSDFTGTEEREAELVATVLAERIAALRSTPGPEATGTLQRIARSFGGPPPMGQR